MITYFDELSSDTKQNIPKHIRLKRIKKGSEKNEYIFQTILSDDTKHNAHLTGNMIVRVNPSQKEIIWENVYPNANIRQSKENPEELRKSGLGTYAEALSMLALSKIIKNSKDYHFKIEKDASTERLNHLKRLGIQKDMSYEERLTKLLKYIEKKDFDIKGVREQNDIYSFLMES